MKDLAYDNELSQAEFSFLKAQLRRATACSDEEKLEILDAFLSLERHRKSIAAPISGSSAAGAGKLKFRLADA